MHKKEPALHPETEKPKSNLYAAASVELDAILAQNRHNELTLQLGAEYDFGELNTSFFHA